MLHPVLSCEHPEPRNIKGKDGSNSSWTRILTFSSAPHTARKVIKKGDGYSIQLLSSHTDLSLSQIDDGTVEVGRRGHLDGHVGLVVAEVEGLLAAIAAAAPAVIAAVSAGFTMTLGCKSRKEGRLKQK